MNDRIVIVTGAGGGIGRVVTQRWLDAGAQVLAVGGHDVVTVEPHERLAKVTTDLSTAQGALDMVAAARDHFGTPDTLVHLVGGFGMGPLTDEDGETQWNKMMRINADAAFHSFRAVTPGFRELGHGWIVAMSSRTVTAPPANMAAYAASKAALEALLRSVAEELRPEGIHANLIVTSTVDTPSNRAAMGDEHASAWVKAEEIADGTIYLCSHMASAVYGATLEIFGRA